MRKTGDRQERRSRRAIARLVFNPHSDGGRDPRRRLEHALNSLQEQGLRVDVVTVSSAERASAVAADAVRSGYRLVIAMGGDGTVEAAARGLIGTKTRLGILPAGTYNNVARSLGIPENIEEACLIVAEGNKRRIDVGQVVSKKHGKAYFFEAAVIGLESALYPPWAMPCRSATGVAWSTSSVPWSASACP